MTDYEKMAEEFRPSDLRRYCLRMTPRFNGVVHEVESFIWCNEQNAERMFEILQMGAWPAQAWLTIGQFPVGAVAAKPTIVDGPAADTPPSSRSDRATVG